MANQLIEDVKYKFKSSNPVTRLIAINTAIFLIISILRILAFVFQNTFILSSVMENIMFPLSLYGLIYKPWTLVTYMFAHEELLHLFWNMISLYWFGQLLIEYTSAKKIIPLYILGGIAGAIFTLLLFLLIPSLHSYVGSQLIGASAGVTAIIVASATLIPEYKMNFMFIGPVKLLYVAIFVVFIDVLSIASYSNVGGNLAHLGGALMGYFFIVQYKKGNDWAKPINMFFDWINRIFKFSHKPKMTVAYKRKISDEEYNYNKKVEQKTIDEILDKISKSGYESLSKAEKEILFKASKK